jgi:serine phosphatase RsbU (regulator of sigma subunit)
VYANAGHIYPMVWSDQATGAEEPNYLKVRGIPIGILPEWQAQSGRLVLSPGDTLLLASDGITEAMVSNKLLAPAKTVDGVLSTSRSMLKQDGLWQILQDEPKPLSLNHLLARIQADNPVQEDDQTILSLEVL